MEAQLTLNPVSINQNVPKLLEVKIHPSTIRSLPETMVKSPFIEANTEGTTLDIPGQTEHPIPV